MRDSTIAPYTQYPESGYLANAMRGHDRYNFPWFDRNAAWLRAKGVWVISPADIDREEGFNEETDPFTDVDLENAVRRDVEALINTDAIFLGPDWEKSKGATAERAVAEWLNRQVWYVDADSNLFVPDGYAEGF